MSFTFIFNVGKRSQPTFLPGVIIKIQNYMVESSRNICMEIKKLREHFSSHGEVAYIDIREERVCYVRCVQ